MVRYLDPSNWLALEVRSSDDKIRLLRRQDDGTISTVYTSVSGSGMSDGNWYNCKLVIGDDPGNSALQQLRFWVDLNNNGSFELGEKVAETTVVDDDWSAGSVGLFRGSDGTNVARFDDFKIGFDNSGPEDNDFDDGGDEIAIDDNFNSNATNLVYDNNGNCTDDGVFKYVYDAWNRLVGAKHRSAANATTVATYEYSGSHSRMTHVITNTGVENELGDGGERTGQILE
ncbi:MAG: hypothetical protein AMXMBFR47_05700 [Planctomycetota bacterium]